MSARTCSRSAAYSRAAALRGPEAGAASAGSSRTLSVGECETRHGDDMGTTARHNPVIFGPVGHAGPALDHADIDHVAPGVPRRPTEAPDRHTAGVGVDGGGKRPDRGRERCQRRDGDQHARGEQRAGTMEEVGHHGAG